MREVYLLLPELDDVMELSGEGSGGDGARRVEVGRELRLGCGLELGRELELSRELLDEGRECCCRLGLGQSHTCRIQRAILTSCFKTAMIQG